MSNKELSGQIAGACFVIIFVSMIFMGVYAVGYKQGVKAAIVENAQPIYHIGAMPIETPVLALYNNGGIVTMETARKLDDGRILPHSVRSNQTYYDLMPEPIGWTAIPPALVEAMK